MRCRVPVIASGGVGTLDHLADGVQQGGADAVLAASIFHYGEHTVGEAKALMAARGIPGPAVRARSGLPIAPSPTERTWRDSRRPDPIPLTSGQAASSRRARWSASRRERSARPSSRGSPAAKAAPATIALIRRKLP